MSALLAFQMSLMGDFGTKDTPSRSWVVGISMATAMYQRFRMKIWHPAFAIDIALASPLHTPKQQRSTDQCRDIAVVKSIALVTVKRHLVLSQHFTRWRLTLIEFECPSTWLLIALPHPVHSLLTAPIPFLSSILFSCHNTSFDHGGLLDPNQARAYKGVLLPRRT